jgi:hypothetical protein
MNIIEKIDKLLVGEGIFKQATQAAADFIGIQIDALDHYLAQKRIGQHVSMTWDKKKIKELKKMTKKLEKDLKKELGPDWRKAKPEDLSKQSSDLFWKVLKMRSDIYGY